MLPTTINVIRPHNLRCAGYQQQQMQSTMLKSIHHVVLYSYVSHAAMQHA